MFDRIFEKDHKFPRMISVDDFSFPFGIYLPFSVYGTKDFRRIGWKKEHL